MAEPLVGNSIKRTEAQAARRQIIEPSASGEVQNNWDLLANKKHSVEEQGAVEPTATSIGFTNASSAQVAIFELTRETERQFHGLLAPRMTSEFPTRTGTRWLVADAKYNAFAVFMADGQPRIIGMNDDQVQIWKQHQTLDQIVVRGERGETLQTFCMGPNDHIFALLAVPQVYGELNGEVPVAQDSGASHTGEVRIYLPSGEEVGRFRLDFKPHRISVAPDGEIVIGGFGVIARFTPKGQLVSKHIPPNLNGSDRDWMQAAKDAREVSITHCKEEIALLEEQCRAQNSKAEMFDELIRPLRQQLESLHSQSIEESVEVLKQSLGQVHAIAASNDTLYVAMQMSTGFGFAVWKMNRNATDGKLIVENLAGCCGHLDIQAKGDNLFVAENSRHRVLKFDNEGKKLAQFGSRERGGDGEGFGGCCNPMNLYFPANGDFFTAESEGRVKCFTQEGKFISELAAVRISAGCRDVAIGATKNRDRVFVLDLTESKIIISKIREGAVAPGS